MSYLLLWRPPLPLGSVKGVKVSMFSLSLEDLVILWVSAHLGTLQPKLPGGLKKIYDFVDYVTFFSFFFSSVFSYSK